MSSYFSSLLTTTTSRVASLRQTILFSEADGDTDDDTHLCRVLRAYYSEKGRPFPGWLPPDPKAPAPMMQPVYTTNNIGAGYGVMNTQGGAGGGGLSSLWDSQPAGGALPPQQPQSLRRGRGAGALAVPNRDPYNRSQTSSAEPPVQARPLPSQRAGSYQTTSGYARNDASGTPPASSGMGSASDKLKARLLGGGRSTSPALGNSGTAVPVQQRGGYDRGNSYESSGGRSQVGGRSNNSGGSYEDRLAPQEKPFMAATSPWASNEEEFNPGYGSSRQPTNGRRMR